LHSTLLYLVLPLPNCSHGRSSPGRPCHAMAPVDRSRPPASRVTTSAGHNLPHNAAAAPWPQPPTQRSGYAVATPRPRPGVQGCCRSQMAAPSHSQTTATLEIKGKNKKIIWPNMGSNLTPLGRSKSISSTRPPPLLLYVVLFKFTYNFPFVNNVYSVTLSKLF
jgi:hypothetical protein